MKGNYRNQSNETVFIFFLVIVVCYAGLLYTWINQQNDEAEAYGSQPWSSAFNAAEGAPQSIAPNTFSSSSPTFTYPHRSARGIHISSGGGVHRFGVPVPTGGTGFRVYNSAGANAGASSTSYAFRSTTRSVGSSTSGIPLTSDAVLHSYGGGNAAGSSMQGASSQSRSAQGNATGGVSLAAPVLTVSLPVYTLAYTPTTTGNNDAQAAAAAMASAQWQQHTGFSGSGAIFSSPISSPYRTVNGVSSFLSADEYLANSNGNSASSRYRAPGTIPDPIEQWLNSLIAQGLGGYTGLIDGTHYFDLAALKAYYEQLIAGNNMPGFTWEEILTWFNTQEGTKTYDFNPLPVGEPWVLLILAALYAVYLLWRRSPRYIQRP